MRYTFVGDVHGRWEIVEEVLQREGPIVFVGDFVDSYDRSTHEMRRCLELVEPALASGKALACVGNHEESYLHGYTCSGFRAETSKMMDDYGNRVVHKYFKYYHLLRPDFLVTHAGLTKQLATPDLVEWGVVNEQVLQKKIEDGTLLGAGRCRGGPNPVGGITWCDFKHEFQPVSGLTQVFGHTRGSTLRQIENSYCIDFLESNPSQHLLELDV